MANSILDRQLRLLAGSAFFDATWYLSRNADVAAGQLDPMLHYLTVGGQEGRDPGPMFDTKAYLERRPDVAAARVNPLVHFLQYGIGEMFEDLPSAGIRLFDNCGEECLPVSDQTGIPAEKQIKTAFCSDLEELPDRDATSQAKLPYVRKKNGPKAVFVTHDANIGGAPAVLATLARWFQRHTDYDVQIVAMCGGPWIPIFQAIGPTFVVGHIDVPGEAIPALRNSLKSFIGEQPAFVFINSAAGGGYCEIDPFDAPVFGFIHELSNILTMFERPFKTLMAKADYVFCVGPRVHQAIRKSGDFGDVKIAERTAFIDKPIDDRFLNALDKMAFRRELNWPETTKVVVGCGVVHWRKQPDVFVRVAAKLLANTERDVRFVWIGDGPDLEEMKALALNLGVGHRVEFMGHRDDISELLRAADVFALTSSEDPFPLVCLEAAAASMPSVIFREAGGMIALVEPDGEAAGGIAVSIGDEDAFCKAIDKLLTDDPLREKLARVAHERVLEKYTADAACMEILGTVRQVANVVPRVSVVVPNYNCAPYLERRLDSIANQSFRDVEILLLDDCSTDGSAAILSAFAAKHPEATLYLADKNSGSAFNAWERGLNASSGDLVWIAEADDWCEPTFLEHAIAAFGISGVCLVHGRSVPVNERGETAGDYNELYLDRIAPGRWRSSFCEPAAKEIHLALGRANSIPNASAVIVRRAPALRAITAAKAFRLAGDWAFYVTAIAGGRIAYVHEAINYHRRHPSTVTHLIEGSPDYFRELANVALLVRRIYGPNPAREHAFRTFLRKEAQRFGYTAPLPDGCLPPELDMSQKPRVLFGVGDLSGGGAQMYAVRFVNAWVKSGATAVLFATGYSPDSPALRSQVSANVPIVSSEEINATGLSKFMDDWGIDVVITGHWWADRAVGIWKEQEDVRAPWVIVMHGCYENVLESKEHFPSMYEDFSRAQRYCDQWIWTAPKNKSVFEQAYIVPRRISNIVSGFDPVLRSDLRRADLGIPEDALVFTLASRAIEEKGWRVAVEAYRQVKCQADKGRDLRLQLIGDGPVSEEFRAGEPIDGVSIVPYTARLADYINVSDVCLLPSWFPGESLPLVLIEFLAQGKPAIVSDIGMCGWAIEAESAQRSAGFVVPRNGHGGRVSVQDLASAMMNFIIDPKLSRTLAPSAYRAFEKFRLDRMIEEYRLLLERLLAERSHPMQ